MELFERAWRVVVCASVVSVVGAAALDAQVASAILKEGDPMPAVGPTESIASFGNVEVNGVGGFAVGFNTTGGFSCIYGDFTGFGTGALLRVEGTIGNYQQTGFESFFGIDDSGSIAYSPSTNDLVSSQTGLDSVWVDNTPIAVEGMPIVNVPGTVWRFASRPKMLGSGQAYFVGGIDDAVTGADLGNGLFLGNPPAPILRSGDVIAGLQNPIGGADIDFDARFSHFGLHHLVPVAITTGSGVTTNNDNFILLDGLPISTGASIIGEDRPIPASHGGLPLEVWDNFDEVGISDNGEFMFYGDTDKAGTTTDEFIARNGIIIYRELDTFSGFQLVGSIESGYMNEAGDIVATWDIEGGTTDPEALLQNDKILVKVGDALDITGDGIPDAAFLRNLTGIANVGIGWDRRVWFTADWDFANTSATSDDMDGWFTIQDPCGPVRRYGVGCAGSGGFVPRIELAGCASPGGNVSLNVTKGLGGSTALLFFGLAKSGLQIGGSDCFLNVAPIFGGVLALPLGGAGPGDGSIVVPTTIPVGTPQVTFTLQAFVVDPGSSVGGTGSAALEVTIQ